MIRFSLLEKTAAREYLYKLFDILYENMSGIACTGHTYEDDKKTWTEKTVKDIKNKSREIILIYDRSEIVGFFMYSVNGEVLLMEEIQFCRSYQGSSGIFLALHDYLFTILPKGLKYVEAYAHKNNVKSQGILKHLGLKPAASRNSGNLLGFSGEYNDFVYWYKNKKR